MLSDPSVITINAVAKNLVRINQDAYSSEYLLRTATDEFRLKVRNQTYAPKGKTVLIDRHNIDLTHTIFPVAPSTVSTVRKCYVVIENQQGDTLVDPVLEAIGLLSFLTASSGANLTKMLNFES